MCVRVLPHSSLSRLVQCVCDWVRECVCVSVCARAAEPRTLWAGYALRSRRERERESERESMDSASTFLFFSPLPLLPSLTNMYERKRSFIRYWWSMNELSVTVTTWYNTGFICSGVIHHTLDIPFIFYRPTTATSPAGCINHTIPWWTGLSVQVVKREIPLIPRISYLGSAHLILIFFYVLPLY